MKKIIAFIMTLLVVIPLVSVYAITGNYFTYTAGMQVNFYLYEGDTNGHTTLILKDEGANDQYVKVLMAVGLEASTNVPYCEDIDQCTNFKTSANYEWLLSAINETYKGFGYAKPIAEDGNLSLITLQELIDILGAKKDGDKYTIDVNKWGKFFDDVEGYKKSGFYTETVEGNDVWVVKTPRDANGKITSISVEKEPKDSPTTWAYIPVIYADKTYDCHERDTQKEYACYQCDESYVWTGVGDQDEACTLVEGKTKSTCVKNEKTGVEEYFFEFAVVISVCAIALALVKRKDLFRGI